MSKENKGTYDEKRETYIEFLKPLFLPDDPVSHDIINYFSSLLRVFGMEDRGWDPYAESRATLEDLNSFFKLNLPEEYFPDPGATHWRLGLLLYSHIVEMDAPYEVLTNLLRFQLNKGYNPNAYFEFLTVKEKESIAKRSLPTGRKIKIIKDLSAEVGLPNVGAIFDDFYDNHLRNAIGHSDFILTNDDFRCRGSASGITGFQISYAKLNKKLTAAKAFIAAFFQIERWAREVWGLQKHKALPYDPHYKGLIEVLVDAHNTMCGFRVHWPNGSESTYSRTKDSIEMDNCYADPLAATICLLVGQYAREPGDFSPLVEQGAEPNYSKLQGADELPKWPTKNTEGQ